MAATIIAAGRNLPSGIFHWKRQGGGPLGSARLRCRARRHHAAGLFRHCRFKRFRKGENRRNQSGSGKPIVRPKRLCRRIWRRTPAKARQFMLQRKMNYDPIVPNGVRYDAAASAISISFSTLFQLRAVLGTPMPLSNFAPSLEVPKPSGVWR